MKKMQFPIRLVSLLLVLALLWGLSAPIGATGANEAEISFVQVDNSAVSANLLEQQAETHAESSHASTDMVRVSIVLEKKSVLNRVSGRADWQQPCCHGLPGQFGSGAEPCARAD
ncbi:MAG: hypothetical protein ACLSV7_03495 [Oscillospiraceae bacterium]